jgi:hypothetical protein
VGRILVVVVVALSLCAPSAFAAERSKPRWPNHIATNYDMFSRAGNRAVRHVVWRASRALKAGWSRKRTMARVRRDYRRVENRHEEAYDTAVCEVFADELDRWLYAAGYDPVDAFDEFAFSDDELLDGLSPSPDKSNPLAA